MSQQGQVFNELVKNKLWPDFKSLGYKKSGNNFKFYDASGWGRVVQFQKSQSNSATDLTFTVNTGLYLPEGTCSFPDSPGATFSEPDCIIRQRLGRLKGKQYDEWYTITPGADASVLVEQLTKDFTQVLHPYLAAIQGREDILNILQSGANGSTEVQRIRTLCLAGRKEVASQLLSGSLLYTKSAFDRSALKSLANELGIITRVN
jgi:hypothetical protein